MASVMSALAEFEGDLLRERVRSGVAAAQARGVVFGRRPGQRTKSDLSLIHISERAGKADRRSSRMPSSA